MILFARICADSRPIFPPRVMFAAFDSHGRRNEEVFFLAVDEESNLSSVLRDCTSVVGIRRPAAAV